MCADAAAAEHARRTSSGRRARGVSSTRRRQGDRRLRQRRRQPSRRASRCSSSADVPGRCASAWPPATSRWDDECCTGAPVVIAAGLFGRARPARSWSATWCAAGRATAQRQLRQVGPVEVDGIGEPVETFAVEWQPLVRGRRTLERASARRSRCRRARHGAAAAVGRPRSRVAASVRRMGSQPRPVPARWC